MERTTVPIAAVGTRHRVILWIVLLLTAALGAPIGLAMWSAIAQGLEEGASFGVALLFAMVAFDNPLREAIIMIVLCVLFFVCAVDLVLGYPRVHTRRAVRIGRDGIELRTHARWWYRGGRVLLPWEDIQVVSVRRVFSDSKTGRRSRPAPRQALDLYVGQLEDVQRVPDFASTASPSETSIRGVSRSAVRVRVTDSAKGVPPSVEALANAIDATRPDLLERPDQWPEPRPPTDPALFALPAPLWLDFRHSPWQGIATLAGVLSLTAGSYAASQALSGSGGGALSTLLSIVVAIPLLFGLIATPALVAFLPRALARCGILIDAAGIEFVEKRRLGLRLARARIPWNDVQAIVSRDAVSRNGVTRTATDIYLYADSQFHTPGVGLSAKVTLLQKADTSAVPSHIVFPALRVRLANRTETTGRGVAKYATLPSSGAEPRPVPTARLPTALSAARPDLWHGVPRDGFPRKSEP